MRKVVPITVRKNIQHMLLLTHGELGCLVTKMEDQYWLFYDVYIIPEEYGFDGWREMLKSMQSEVQIKTINRHSVVFAKSLTYREGRDILKRLSSKEKKEDSQSDSESTATKRTRVDTSDEDDDDFSITKLLSNQS